MVCLNYQFIMSTFKFKDRKNNLYKQLPLTNTKSVYKTVYKQ